MIPLAAPPPETPPSPAFTQAGRWLRRALVALLALLLAAFLFDTLFPPVSTLMLGRWLTGQKVERVALRLDQVSPALVAAVVSSEDGRFCRHWGVDWGALSGAIQDARDGERARGASTLTMQLVKNLFLSPRRLFFRKALEIPLALVLDLLWSKQRILTAYFNVAEWGDGIFGAEAAARAYFHKSAAALTPREAALLAAALPNPIKRDPRRPSYGHARLAERILARMARRAAPVDCVRLR
jgi:monofunctional biosynthetic peptidoglycan transglycosylase